MMVERMMIIFVIIQRNKNSFKLAATNWTAILLRNNCKAHLYLRLTHYSCVTQTESLPTTF